MKMNTFITCLTTAFLLALTLTPLADVEARIEYVEKDFTVMVLPNSDGEGFEPHVLAGPSIDGDQWYYVDSPTGLGNTQGGNLWISKDHGETWAWYDKDSVVGSSGDSYTAVTRDGAIYYTDLYLSTASVDSSLDGGETWVANPFASVYVLDDRQWLHVGPNSQGGENIYFSFNELLIGLVMVKAEYTGLTGVALDWKPCNAGLPISSNVGSRDNFAVDQNNGNIYHANYQSNGVFCYVSTNEGNSFTGYQVHDETVHANVQNTFIDMDVDSAGNVYMMWSSRDHIMLGISTDEGSSWDVKEVTELDGCRVLPWIAAGDEGRIAMAWYDTNQTGNPNNLDNAWWDFVVALSIGKQQCVDAPWHEDITAYQLDVAWTTTAPATCHVRYGMTKNSLGEVWLEEPLATEHAFTVELSYFSFITAEVGTEIYFNIRCWDEDEAESYSSFKTVTMDQELVDSPCTSDEECSDGGYVMCRTMPPDCSAGKVLAAVDGCYRCVFPNTCSCDDGLDVDECDGIPAEDECEKYELLAWQGGCFTCVNPMTCEPVE